MLRVKNKKLRRRGQKSKKPILGIFLMLLVACVTYGLFLGYSSFSDWKKSFASETDQIVEKIVKKEPPKPKIQESELREKIAAVTAQYPAVNVTVVLSEPEKEAPIIIGSNESYLGASTTKLISAIYFLTGVESGKHTLSEYFGSYTAEWHLKQLINQSNNTSWDLFIRHLGYRNIENYAHLIGATSFDNNTNEITPSDMNLITKKLYNGELLNEANTDLLYSHMTGTNNEDLIPASFKDETVVLHKYGIYGGNLHDTAIVKDKNSTYILTIFTKNSASLSYESRTVLFHDLVKQISWYQNNK